jgi:hypothetical protein
MKWCVNVSNQKSQSTVINSFLCLGLSLLAVSCGNFTGGGSSSPPVKTSNTGSTLDLHISGFEETVWESARQGKDQSFTLNLIASQPDTNGRMKPSAILFTKRLGVNDLESPGHKFKANGEEASTEGPVVISLPAGVTEIGASLIGSQSGFIASEKIAIDPLATATSTLFMNIDTLSEDLVAHTQESLIDIALYTSVNEPQGEEESASTKPSRNKSGTSSVNPGNEFQILVIDDGELSVVTKVRKGYGGTGSIGISNDDGDMSFVVQKGKEPSSSAGLVAVSMANDGSMKRFSLPPASTPLTIATDLITGLVFELRPLENRLIVRRHTDSGNLEEIQDIATGRKPSMVYRVPLSRQVLVANSGDKTVSVFDINANDSLTLIDTIKMEGAPLAIIATPDGKFVYVSLKNGGISRFSVGEDARMRFLDTIATERSVISFAMNEAGDTLSGLLSRSNAACSTGTSCKAISDNGTTDLGVRVPDGVVDAAIDLEVGKDEISSDIAPEGARQKSSRKVRITIKKNGTGTGRVISDPGGIDCGGSCEYTRFSRYSHVTLTAYPDEDSVFVEFGRNGCQAGNVCSWKNSDSRDIAVTFNKKPPKPPAPPPPVVGIHWFRESLDRKVALNVGTNVTGVWNTDGLLDGAIAQWNKALVVDIRKVNGSGACVDGIPGQIEVCNADYGESVLGIKALGVARIWWNGEGHIQQGLILLNDSYLVLGRYNIGGAKYDTYAYRQMVICQELGHTIGLTPMGSPSQISHRDDNHSNSNLGTCMDYTNDPDGSLREQRSNLQPDEEDFRQLEAIHNHSDSGNRKARFNDRFLKINPRSRDKGRLVRLSRDGGIQVYERGFGQGRKIITYVLAPTRRK